MSQPYDLQALSNRDLEATLDRLVKHRSRVNADLVAHISEFDARRLYAKHACSSTFVYCQTRLHLSESSASKCIRAARLARQFPMVLDWLRDGDIHLSGLVLLAPHLTKTNHQELLNKARHRSKRDIERLVAEHFPQPDVPERIRKLPMPRVSQKASSTSALSTSASSTSALSTSASEPRFALTPAAAPKPSKVEPLAKARYRVEFTASQKLRDDIETAKALLGPQGQGLEGMFEEAMALFVENLKKKKYAKTPRPRRAKSKSKSNDQADDGKRSRHVPNEVKRQVAERDDYQCAFVDEEGNRCQERWGLELHHHEVAFARGGAHTTNNVQLMCKPHNRYLAELEFGKAYIEDKIQMSQSIPRGM